MRNQRLQTAGNIRFAILASTRPLDTPAIVRNERIVERQQRIEEIHAAERNYVIFD